MSETAPAAPATSELPSAPMSGDGFTAYHDAREAALFERIKVWVREEIASLRGAAPAAPDPATTSADPPPPAEPENPAP